MFQYIMFEYIFLMHHKLASPFNHLSSLPSQLGRTKVFLRAGQIGVLDLRRAEVLDNSAKLIQRQLRTFIARKDFVLARAAALVLQAYCRGPFALNDILLELRLPFCLFCR